MPALRTSFVIAAACIALGAACSAEDALLPIPLACFTVSLGAWTPSLPEALPPLPTGIRLTESLGTEGLEAGRQQIAAVPASEESYRWSWWEQRGTDSLGVVFSTGFTGVSLRLARRGNDFEGSASAFFDFTSESPSATARLTRSACQ
jgi:hypothetical protein